MSFPVCVDLIQQSLLIPLALLFCQLILVLLAVRSCLYMSRIHKYHRLIYQSCCYTFFQYLLKYLLKQICLCKPPRIVLSECTEMRYRIVQSQSQKPTVCVVYLYLPDRLPHTPYSEHILQHRQLDQYDGVEARPSLLLAVAVLHHFIDEAPVDRVFYLSYYMFLRHKLIYARQLDLFPVRRALSRHHVPHHLLHLFYHKKYPN